MDIETTQDHGNAGAKAAATQITRSVPAGGTVAADRGYDQTYVIHTMKARGVKPQEVRKTTGSAVDGRSARG